MRKPVVFFVLAIIVLGSCSVKQKIVGTWVEFESGTWTFNKDGTLSRSGFDYDINYIIIDNKKLSIDDNINKYNITYKIKMINSKNMSIVRFSTKGNEIVYKLWNKEYSLIKK